MGSGYRMFEKIQAAANRDQFGPLNHSQYTKPFQINGIPASGCASGEWRGELYAPRLAKLGPPDHRYRRGRGQPVEASVELLAVVVQM
jgi:hypothetical protein